MTGTSVAGNLDFFLLLMSGKILPISYVKSTSHPCVYARVNAHPYCTYNQNDLSCLDCPLVRVRKTLHNKSVCVLHPCLPT